MKLFGAELNECSLSIEYKDGEIYTCIDGGAKGVIVMLVILACHICTGLKKSEQARKKLLKAITHAMDTVGPECIDLMAQAKENGGGMVS